LSFEADILFQSILYNTGEKKRTVKCEIDEDNDLCKNQKTN